MAWRWNKAALLRAWSAVSVGGIVAVGALNLAAALRRVPPAPRYPSQVPADVAVRHELRFGRVHAALEARGVRGAIGYVTDLAPAAMRDDPAAMEELFLTQFSLVPAVLETEAGRCAWAVTNLHGAHAAERIPAGFRVVEDFGSGVWLLRKAVP